MSQYGITDTISQTEMSYGNIVEWTATYAPKKHFPKTNIEVVGRYTQESDYHAGEICAMFKVDDTHQAIEDAVKAGTMHHNTPAYIACRKVMAAISIWPIQNS